MNKKRIALIIGIVLGASTLVGCSAEKKDEFVFNHTYEAVDGTFKQVPPEDRIMFDSYADMAEELHQGILALDSARYDFFENEEIMDAFLYRSVIEGMKMKIATVDFKGTDTKNVQNLAMEYVEACDFAMQRYIDLGLAYISYEDLTEQEKDVYDSVTAILTDTRQAWTAAMKGLGVE